YRRDETSCVLPPFQRVLLASSLRAAFNISFIMNICDFSSYSFLFGEPMEPCSSSTKASNVCMFLYFYIIPFRLESQISNCVQSYSKEPFRRNYTRVFIDFSS